jgi:transcriptional regulator with XRE-family HTH domain
LEKRGVKTREGDEQVSVSISNISSPAEFLAALLLYEISWPKSSLFIIIYTDSHWDQNMPQIVDNDDIPGIQRLIQSLAAAEKISIYELAERSGLHPTTLYAILKKRPSATRRPVRRETIRALADGCRYEVMFDAVRQRVILDKSEAPEPRNDVEELLEGIRRVLTRSHRRKYSSEEREMILRVMGAMTSK